MSNLLTNVFCKSYRSKDGDNISRAIMARIANRSIWFCITFSENKYGGEVKLFKYNKSQIPDLEKTKLVYWKQFSLISNIQRLAK